MKLLLSLRLPTQYFNFISLFEIDKDDFTPKDVNRIFADIAICLYICRYAINK